MKLRLESWFIISYFNFAFLYMYICCYDCSQLKLKLQAEKCSEELPFRKSNRSTTRFGYRKRRYHQIYQPWKRGITNTVTKYRRWYCVYKITIDMNENIKTLHHRPTDVEFNNCYSRSVYFNNEQIKYWIVSQPEKCNTIQTRKPKN